jgi:hypothetical protein
MAKNKRVSQNSSVMDSGAIAAAAFNAYSGADKVVMSGPDFKKISTNNFTSGQTANAAGIPVKVGGILWLYNNSGSVAWFVLSTDAAVGAPSSFSTGIPLAANSWFQVACGENSIVRTSAATVGVYIMNDDTTLVDQ